MNISKRNVPVLHALTLLAIVACCRISAGAQTQNTGESKAASQVRQGTAPAEASKDENYGKGLHWRNIGPFRGGRVLAVAGVPGNPNVYYFGAVAGGVWKTTNGGVSWAPMTDKENFASVGSIAVAPSDPNVIYAGSGEACIRGNISFGNGVYKSVDAGHTWMHLGLEDTQHIGKVIVDPANPNIVFVAALGHAYGPNIERGVFRSADGGATWQKVLYKDEKTGAIDIAFDPANSHILYASLWQAYRTPWSLEDGGAGSGLYKSTDGGLTWKRLEGHGLPTGILGRIGVSISGADSSRVYALIEAKDAGLYRSDDAGATWKKINDDHRFTQRPWYYMHIFADPRSANTVYILNTGMFRSTDGGEKFDLLPAPHGDHHGLWIDPLDPQRLINGNDGGATISVDGGKTWTRQNNQPTAQFYHVSADNEFFYNVYGAQQDNSTVGIASRNYDGLLGEHDWDSVGGGESGYIVADPGDSNVIYSGDNGGTIARFDKRTGQTQDITVWPDNYSGHGDGEMKHRFQWTAPIATSPHDPSVLYQGGELLFKTTNGGHSWTAISPDLTRNDKSKQVSSGGPITKDNTSVEYYDTIFAIAESPRAKDQIWVGSDDGLVHLTRDAGKNWTDVTPKGFPEWATVSLIEPSPHDAGAAYVAIDAHKLDDLHPYIFATKDYGKTWAKIVGGLPDNAYVHAVREDTVRKGLLFAGTETGMFISYDDGASWRAFQLNLPPSPIHDLIIKNDDLIAATHGRSFWILDDISPLRESMSAGDSAHLYHPAAAYRTRLGGPVPARYFAEFGENAPSGAVLYYSLPSEPKDEITLEILDRRGKLVRKFSSKTSQTTAVQQQEWPDQEQPSDIIPSDAGLNRFIWDLRYTPPREVPGAVYDGGDEPKGALALPGTYLLRLNAFGATATAPLELKMDPRLKATPEDLRQQFDLAMKIRNKFDEVNDTINQIREVRAQLQALDHRIGAVQRYQTIHDSGAALDKQMTAMEDALMNKNVKATEDTLNYPVRINNKLSTLMLVVDSADTAPTEQAAALLDDLSQQADQQIAQWKQLREKDLAALNDLVRKENIPAIAPSPAGANPTATPAGGRH